jgi:hypothetical protein
MLFVLYTTIFSVNDIKLKRFHFAFLNHGICFVSSQLSIFFLIMSEEEWSQAYDESGQLYYFNVVTGETTWQLPQSINQTEQPEGIPVF